MTTLLLVESPIKQGTFVKIYLGGYIAQWIALHPAAPCSILGVPKIFSEKFEFLDVVGIYQQ